MRILFFEPQMVLETAPDFAGGFDRPTQLALVSGTSTESHSIGETHHGLDAALRY